ncbi:Yip1 family protein [Aeromonas molluscorum]|uniref:Yip1 family protein n=1 Tax=Aeromonas molluscorum TaxID=271417 RepID=UPI003F1D5341
MILNHIWGLYAHPKDEWHDIDDHQETVGHSLTHVALMALIPAVCCYFSAVHIGWQVGRSDPIMLTMSSGVWMASAMYLALMVAVVLLAVLALWMARTFGANPNMSQTLELAAYTATPLFMTGFAALYPVMWFIMLVGLVGLAWSIYLLYTGIPILMHIPEEQGFIYASSMVTCGLVLLVCLMAGTVLVWDWGLGPVFTS